MPTWLHDVEVFASLADGEPGPAQDWGTTRLALAAPDRYRTFPRDERCHDVLLAAGAPRLLPSILEALATRRPCTSGLANAASALGMYGQLPEDTAPLAEAMRGALRDDGDEADVWLGYGLSMIGAADERVLVAVAKNRGLHSDWVLPIVVLRVAERAGALPEAAAEIAADVHRRSERDLHRLFELLMVLGVPVGALRHRYDTIEEAVEMGSHLGHAHAPTIKVPPGSVRRRQQHWVRGLLEGVPGPAAALLREVYTRDPRPEWGLWPLAVAAWLRGQAKDDVSHAGVDVLHDVMHHFAGGDTRLLSAARRAVNPGLRDALLEATHNYPDLPIAMLAVELVRRSSAAPDTELASAILHMHGGNPDANVRTAALAVVAGWHHPDAIPGYLKHEDLARRVLGLVCSEWTPTAEVMQALLEMPVPVDPVLQLQYARSLASMGDQAVLPVLEALIRQDTAGALAEPKALAEELLHVAIA
jgi:hypothetical protein